MTAAAEHTEPVRPAWRAPGATPAPRLADGVELFG